MSGSGLDLQMVFDIALAIIGSLGGWLMRILWDSIAGLTKKIEEIEQKAVDTYARRDDVNNLQEALFRKLDRIEDKLDRKADKQP